MADPLLDIFRSLQESELSPGSPLISFRLNAIVIQD